jgi:hypothetical protein
LWLAAAAALVWPTAAQHHSGGSSANCWGKFTHYLQIDWSQLKKKYAADIVVFNSNFFLHETESWIIEGLN